MTRVFPDNYWSAVGWMVEKFSRGYWRPTARHQFLAHPHGIGFHSHWANGRVRRISINPLTQVQTWRGSHAALA